MFLVNSVWSQHNRDNMRDMLLEDLEIAMKVVIVGNGAIGKSSMIQRFCRGIFTRDYKKTIGVDFLERILMIEDHSVRLMLWDTAGQEEFDAITRTYYRGANACVLACSVTDKESFLALPKWKNKVCRECGDIPMVLVANKFDLQKQAVVDSAELEAMARSLGITKLFRTSVKEDLNVNSVFNHLAQQYVQLVASQTAEEEEEDLLGQTDDDTTHLHHIHSPLFGNNKSSKASKPPKNVSKTQTNNKSLFRNPVILKSHSQQANGNVNGNNNPSKGFFASALGVKTKNSNNNTSNSNNNHQQLLHHNSSNIKSSMSHLTNNSNGQIVHHHAPHHHYSAYTNGYGGGLAIGSNRWNDTMPFRLDIVKGKKRRREACSIL